MLIFFLLLYLGSRCVHRLLDAAIHKPPHAFVGDVAPHRLDFDYWQAFNEHYEKVRDAQQYRERKRRVQEMKEYGERVWQKVHSNRHLQIDLFFFSLALLASVLSLCVATPATETLTCAPDECVCSEPVQQQQQKEEGEEEVIYEASGNRSLCALVLGLAMPECRASTETDTYCHASAEWQQPVRDAYRYVMRFVAPRDPAQRRHFVDETGGRYFTEHTLRDPQESGVTLVSERRLLAELAALHDASGPTCLCPLHLGLLDNVSFHAYRTPHGDNETRWHIMHDPWLVRNATNSPLVHSTVAPLAPAFGHLCRTTVEHAETFTVEFSEATQRLDDATRTTLTGFNNRLHLHYKERRRSRGEEVFILHRVETKKYVDRVRVTLSGAAAACFIYCQRLSGAL